MRINMKPLAVCLAGALMAGVVFFTAVQIGNKDSTLDNNLFAAFVISIIWFIFGCSVVFLRAEKHQGWKRLTLLIALFTGVTMPLYIFTRVLGERLKDDIAFYLLPYVVFTPLLFTSVVFAILGSKKAVLWVKDGFAKSGGSL